MKSIKAIETHYDGYRFRSRLEARWAVVWNSLGVRYEYEPEGFVLPDGTPYLPDFYLPHLDRYIEIKPSKSEDPAGEWVSHPAHKVPDGWAWSADDIANRLIVFSGTPGLNDSGEPTYGGTVFADNRYCLCECPNCGGIGIEFDGRSDRLRCKASPNPLVRYPGARCPVSEHQDKGYSADTPRLRTAYKAARSARFEHGEKPRV